uniref:Uncharacterized protein n=1 Tax=Aegilops tauschii TaxID=37682 RepID=M8BC74_AEGTA
MEDGAASLVNGIKGRDVKVDEAAAGSPAVNTGVRPGGDLRPPQSPVEEASHPCVPSLSQFLASHRNPRWELLAYNSEQPLAYLKDAQQRSDISQSQHQRHCFLGLLCKEEQLVRFPLASFHLGGSPMATEGMLHGGVIPFSSSSVLLRASSIPQPDGSSDCAQNCVSGTSQLVVPGWNKRNIGVEGPDSRVTPSKMSAIEERLLQLKDRTGDAIFEPTAGTTFDSSQEAYDFYNLYSGSVDLASVAQKESIKDDLAKTMQLLQQMKAEDYNLRVEVDLDDAEGRIRSMLWCTGKNREDYLHFGDVVTFDTTYKTNLYMAMGSDDTAPEPMPVHAGRTMGQAHYNAATTEAALAMAPMLAFQQHRLAEGQIDGEHAKKEAVTAMAPANPNFVAEKRVIYEAVRAQAAATDALLQVIADENNASCASYALPTNYLDGPVGRQQGQRHYFDRGPHVHLQQTGQYPKLISF